MKKIRILLTGLILGLITTAFVSKPSIENVDIYVYNSCNKSVGITTTRTESCNSTGLYRSAKSGVKTRYTCEKGACIKYRGNGGSSSDIVLGKAEYDGQTFNIVDCKGY